MSIEIGEMATTQEEVAQLLKAPFQTVVNDLILRAATGKKVHRVPVWIMRQAGRYLEEFRQFRQKHDFLKICNTPEFASEITLQPLRRFDLDAAIIFSDILVIPQAVGMHLEMLPGKGPNFPTPLNDPAMLEQLIGGTNPAQRAEFLRPVYEAIHITRVQLHGRCPLIGFTGAPWTLMSYMIEGGGSTTQNKAKRWLYADRENSHKFLQLLTEAVIEHLVLQAKAGAQLLQVFESHAGVLNSDLFREYSLPYLTQIAQEVRRRLQETGDPDLNVPLIVFAKDAHYGLEELSRAGYDVVGLDWTVKRKSARCQLGNLEKVSAQGNMDPCFLYSSGDRIEEEVRRMLNDFGVHRYIANLGHGIYPDVDPAKVKIFVDAVHRISEDMISQQE